MEIKNKTPKTKILIVEDEAIICQSLMEFLVDMNYSVVGTADTSEKAIAEFIATKPDLILMDIHLKGNVNGIQTSEEILKNHEVPIVFLTANQDLANFELAKKSGAYGYVLKPFQERELLMAIEIALSQFEDKKRIIKLETTLSKIEKKNLIEKFSLDIINKIKSHLTLLYGATDNLNTLLEQQPDLKQNSSFNSAFELLNKGSNKINDMIKVYRKEIEANEFEMPSLVNVKKVCNNALTLCRYLSLGEKVNFMQPTGPENASVWAAPDTLSQVLVNILRNACGALKNTMNAWINITWEESDENTLILKITDSGNKISHEVKEKILNILSFKSEILSEHLGLHLSQRMLNSYGGSLHLDTTNPNTCFVLKLKRNAIQ